MSAGTGLLFTGATGFIGRRLCLRIAELVRPPRIVLLVEPRLRSQAEALVEELRIWVPATECEIVSGDITRENLGLHEIPNVEWIFHLAALYDLAASKEACHRVNVIGTENVLRVCERLHAKLFYFSTCYVCGERQGLILENELDKGQNFKNAYEGSKFEAERLVRKYNVDAIVVRPAIVVGDSKTGATAKFDGPYVALPALLKMAGFPGGVPVPSGGTARVNLVPVDFVVEASAHLFRQSERNLGKTFQLADPDPLTADALYALFARLLTGREAGLRIPKKAFQFFARSALTRGVLSIPTSALPYFDFDARFDTTETQAALLGSGIQCPSFEDYAKVLVKYWLEHRTRR